MHACALNKRTACSASDTLALTAVCPPLNTDFHIFIFLPQRVPLPPTSLVSQSSHLNDAFHYLPARLCPFLHALVRIAYFFSFFFGFRGPFLHRYVLASCRASTAAPDTQQNRKHSTAQRNQSCTSSKPSTADQSATTQASRVGESQHVERNTTAVSSITQLDVFSKKTKTSESARPTNCLLYTSPSPRDRG